MVKQNQIKVPNVECEYSSCACAGFKPIDWLGWGGGLSWSHNLLVAIRAKEQAIQEAINND